MHWWYIKKTISKNQNIFYDLKYNGWHSNGGEVKLFPTLSIGCGALVKIIENPKIPLLYNLSSNSTTYSNLLTTKEKIIYSIPSH